MPVSLPVPRSNRTSIYHSPQRILITQNLPIARSHLPPSGALTNSVAASCLPSPFLCPPSQRGTLQSHNGNNAPTHSICTTALSACLTLPYFGSLSDRDSGKIGQMCEPSDHQAIRKLKPLIKIRVLRGRSTRTPQPIAEGEGDLPECAVTSLFGMENESSVWCGALSSLWMVICTWIGGGCGKAFERLPERRSYRGPRWL